MFFVPMPFPLFGLRAGAIKPPKTDGATLLAVIAAIVLTGTGGIGFAVAGWAGLLAVPYVIALTMWVSLWGWMMSECIDHSITHKFGGWFVLPGLVCSAVALVSTIGGIMLALYWCGVIPEYPS